MNLSNQTKTYMYYLIKLLIGVEVNKYLYFNPDKFLPTDEDVEEYSLVCSPSWVAIATQETLVNFYRIEIARVCNEILTIDPNLTKITEIKESFTDIFSYPDNSVEITQKFIEDLWKLIG